ncbi:SCO3242 family prenyltransferase [Streptomyces sp. 8K308]|uniref:SCO3242 family prenyltransferase n=1 Tax=Streptomyces sp. 8K308 TaxID=2530388 RepID=UPI0026AAC8DC
MRARDAAELVRLPAALTAPGDSLAGAAAAGWPYGRRSWAAPAASVCLYLAGMALNDFADCDLDARERPERPIPSGRVDAFEALGLATALTGAGLGLAAVAGGRRALRIAVPLAATVWAYDLWAQRTAAGPAFMAAARGLDVLLGAGGHASAAAVPALAMATHTAGVTTLSRGEVHGAPRGAALAALAGTATAAALAAASAARGLAAGRTAEGPVPTGRGGRRVAGTAGTAGTAAAAAAHAARGPASGQAADGLGPVGRRLAARGAASGRWAEALATTGAEEAGVPARPRRGRAVPAHGRTAVDLSGAGAPRSPAASADGLATAAVRPATGPAWLRRIAAVPAGLPGRRPAAVAARGAGEGPATSGVRSATGRAGGAAVAAGLTPLRRDRAVPAHSRRPGAPPPRAGAPGPSAAAGGSAGQVAELPDPAMPAAVLTAGHLAAAVGGVLAAAGYARSVGRAQVAVLRAAGDARAARGATGAGVRGGIGLQSALVAGAGAPVVAAALSALGPLARLASRKVSPT